MSQVEVEHQNDVSSEFLEDLKKRQRRDVSKESLVEDMSSLQERINAEVEKLREGGDRGVKFLRSVNKFLKVMSSDFVRVMKLRPKVKRQNTNSGFMKPVKVSAQMTSFLGISPSELYSRTQITKLLCDYISSHNLRQESNKTIILVNNDKGLNQLLDASHKDFASQQPITYFRLQKFIQHHFQAVEVPAAPAPSAVSSPVVVALPEASKKKRVAPAKAGKSKASKKDEVEDQEAELEEEN